MRAAWRRAVCPTGGTRGRNPQTRCDTRSRRGRIQPARRRRRGSHPGAAVCGHAATLLVAFIATIWTYPNCGNYAAANGLYFGYPQAHENDAERAVRAGLELVTAVGDLKTHAALQTRVGIATGQVVVGDLIGSEEVQERGIVGETPNLAARLHRSFRDEAAN